VLTEEPAVRIFNEQVNHALGKILVNSYVLTPEVVKLNQPDAFREKVKAALTALFRTSSGEAVATQEDADDHKHTLHGYLVYADARRDLLIELFQQYGWGDPEELIQLIDKLWSWARGVSDDCKMVSGRVRYVYPIAKLMKTNTDIVRIKQVKQHWLNRYQETLDALQKGWGGCADKASVQAYQMVAG